MNILLAISGGIAAYKTPDLVRKLQASGHTVSAALTQAATQFVAPLSLRAVCDGEVMETIFTAPDAPDTVEHIKLADWADLIVVAPATAQTVARLAHGFANDPVSLSVLAATCPVMVFPAMNSNMWAADATQANISTLRSRDVHVVDPASGELACGWLGPGRMPDAEVIVAEVESLLHTAPATDVGTLAGRHVVITAGPTREFVDPVRFLSNPSSGKMGFALAQAAANAGTRVTLISGPVTLSTPTGVERINVVSAADMHEAVTDVLNETGADIFIASAAVADYTPADPQKNKIKKQQPLSSINLKPTIDILATVADQYALDYVVGFAAETCNIVEHATEKLQRKKLDLIVANDVGQADRGFASDDNQIFLIDAHASQELPRAPKTELAQTIIAHIARQLASAVAI